MQHYLSLAIKSIFVENILLAFFLGQCSFVACSKKVETAIGLGTAVIFVMTITTPASWFFYNILLRKGAPLLMWLNVPFLDLSFLGFMAYIAVIAAMVQFLEMFLDKYFPALYAALGIFLPLIAVNCAVLGAALFMVKRDYNLMESIVYGASTGMGWAMAIVSMAAIRKKLRYSNIPAGLEGLGIIFIMTGLLAMTFMCFSGIKL
ncbi:MAG: NADH:ubiquinone reductase (Na(+)-transporting) subunit E [Nitrospinae bacterium]|nr:NADH:ubiquinone reductase (Na(+)-transporting) subunit E [Nitrospinota bacterium]